MANVTNYHKASRFNPRLYYFTALEVRNSQSGRQAQAQGRRGWCPRRLPGRPSPAAWVSFWGRPRSLTPTASHRVPPFPFPCGRSAFPPHICLFSREPLRQAYLHTLRFSPAHPWSRLWVPGNRSTGSSDEELGIFGGRYSAHHIHLSFFRKSIVCLAARALAVVHGF